MISTSLLSLVFVCAAPELRASNLNIHFGGFGAPDSTYGAAAGQPGAWNLITSLGVTGNLLNLSGVSTAISLNLTADSDAGALGGTGNTGALRGYNFFSLDGDLWSVTLSNLDNGTYSLYYYAPTNTIVSTGSFTANGLLASNIQGNSTSTLNKGSDWEIRSGVQVTNGTLTLLSADTNGDRGLAGIQLVQTPEPATLLLIGVALGIGLLVRKAACQDHRGASR
jgi:hypothetical protein